LVKPVGYGFLATLVLALLALNVLAWSGRIVDEEPPAPRSETTVPAERPPRPATPPETRTMARTPRAKPAPRPIGTTVLLTATRGDCWVEVRDGSSSGKALYTGTLAAGNSLRFKRPKLWVRLGAAANVDLLVNGRPASVPPGTVELVVPDA
jgi:uncharacterized protein DUF4115